MPHRNHQPHSSARDTAGAAPQCVLCRRSRVWRAAGNRVAREGRRGWRLALGHCGRTRVCLGTRRVRVRKKTRGHGSVWVRGEVRAEGQRRIMADARPQVSARAWGGGRAWGHEVSVGGMDVRSQAWGQARAAGNGVVPGAGRAGVGIAIGMWPGGRARGAAEVRVRARAEVRGGPGAKAWFDARARGGAGNGGGGGLGIVIRDTAGQGARRGGVQLGLC